MFGPAKKHFFFKITYDASKTEGASTWAAPKIEIQERTQTFFLNAEDHETSSDDDEFARTLNDVNARSTSRERLASFKENRMLGLPTRVVPILNNNYTMNHFNSKGRGLL